MAYSAQLDIQNAIGGLKALIQAADWDLDGVPDAAVITDAIAEADGKIDSYASKHYPVPFAIVPPTIKNASANIAKLLIFKRRRMLSQHEQVEWDEWCSTDEQKPGWLLQLAKGIVTPGGDPLPPKHGTMAPDNVQTTLPSDRDYAREKLSGYW